MDNQKLTELAIAAQLIDHRDTEESLPADFVQSLKEFAALVRAAALEEAAEYLESVHRTRLVKFANAIRELKEDASPQPRWKLPTDEEKLFWGLT